MTNLTDFLNVVASAEDWAAAPTSASLRSP
jgi:hypothetical protein